MKHINHSNLHTNSNKSIKRLISDGYAHWVKQKLDKGWKAYILTFTFNSLHGSQSSMLNRMKGEMERIYATMLTRIVRNPLSASKVDRLPIWIVCPDFPVPKHQKQSLRNVVINEGLHLHVICLIPPESRLNQPLRRHVKDHEQLYRGRNKLISAIHVQRIRSSPEYVVEYAFKSIKRRRADEQDIMILPRSRTEMRDTPPGYWESLYTPASDPFARLRSALTSITRRAKIDQKLKPSDAGGLACARR